MYMQKIIKSQVPVAENKKASNKIMFENLNRKFKKRKQLWKGALGMQTISLGRFRKNVFMKLPPNKYSKIDRKSIRYLGSIRKLVSSQLLWQD
jgi:hypothetical protein